MERAGTPICATGSCGRRDTSGRPRLKKRSGGIRMRSSIGSHVNLRFKLTTAPPLREKDVVKACIDLLNVRGYKEHRLPCGKYRAANARGDWQEWYPPGTPDYFMAHPDRPGFYIEFKRPGGRLRRTQVFEHQVLRKGWRLAVVVVDSVEGLTEFLKEHEAR